jgi:hypothetical protein
MTNGTTIEDIEAQAQALEAQAADAVGDTDPEPITLDPEDDGEARMLTDAEVRRRVIGNPSGELVSGLGLMSAADFDMRHGNRPVMEAIADEAVAVLPELDAIARANGGAR